VNTQNRTETSRHDENANMCVARFGVLLKTSPKFYQNFIFPLELSRLWALHCSRREHGKEHSENIEQNRKDYKMSSDKNPCCARDLCCERVRF
jgi:hypothetical protein